MKETTDRKMEVFGSDSRNNGGNANRGTESLALGSRPIVYGQANNSGTQANRLGGGLSFGARAGGGLGGNGLMTPTLDLTSGMMSMSGQNGGDSASQLPRPRE